MSVTGVRLDAKNQDPVRFEVAGRKHVAHHTWFRGEHCNFGPNLANMQSSTAIEDYIVQGWTPARPFIERQTKVTAFGSCFAANISNYLSKRRYSILNREDVNSYVVRFGEGMVNTFAIRQQFEWAFENRKYEEELWHGYDARAHGYDEDVRRNTFEIFNKTEVFIITLGLSEIWYDEQSGGVFWRAVPMDKYDPGRHKFRVSSVTENLDNLRAIYRIIRHHRPAARIVFTLSPIPLVATFRGNSCITSNAVSKSILRAAVDELYREKSDEGSLYYWPSYEIVTEGFTNKFTKDRRHIKKQILDFIMMLFEKHYCTEFSKESSRELLGRYISARVADGTYGVPLMDAMENSDASYVSDYVQRLLSKNRYELAEPIVRYCVPLFSERRSEFRGYLCRIEKSLSGAKDKKWSLIPRALRR